MTQMTPAYAAGLVDGEGCILIQHTKQTYCHLVTIGMTSKARPLLNRMQASWGGRVKIARKATERWDEAHAWTVAGAEATGFLQDIQPYLVLKVEQARIALLIAQIRSELPPRWEHRPDGQRSWTDEGRRRCATLKAYMHQLNAKGQPPSEMPPQGGKFLARRVGDQWLTDQAEMFSDLGWGQFLGRWPASGSVRNGIAYEHPTLAPAMEGSGCSSSPPGVTFLPTPTTRDYKDNRVRREPHRPNDTDTLSRALADLI